MVAGYDEVSALLTDPRLTLDKRHSGTGYTGFSLPPALDRNLLNMDGDEHGRIRRLAAPAFSRQSAENVRTAIARFATRTFADLSDTGSSTVDLMDQLCVPVPALAIGEILGVPKELQPRLREAATDMVTADPTSQESAMRLLGSITWLTKTFGELVQAKRADPGDDLISGWVRARDDADQLSEDELVSLAFLMMLAGSENAVHMCGNIIAAVLDADESAEVVREWPQRRGTLMEQANPLPFTFRRFARADLTLGDHTIATGETVLLSLFAADSDPARNNRPSLMFGRGPHYCLGAQATDWIVDAIVPTFLARYPHARLAIPAAELTYRTSWRSHGLTALPVVLGTAAVP